LATGLVRGRIGEVENFRGSAVGLSVVAGPKEVKGRDRFGADLGIAPKLAAVLFPLGRAF